MAMSNHCQIIWNEKASVLNCWSSMGRNRIDTWSFNIALWFRTAKKGATRSSVCLFACTAHSFICSTVLTSLAHSLTHSLSSSWESDRLDGKWQNTAKIANGYFCFAFFSFLDLGASNQLFNTKESPKNNDSMSTGSTDRRLSYQSIIKRSDLIKQFMMPPTRGMGTKQLSR